ncbi:MAG: MMPL family transporter [Planctomycetes bacterium]|nr:MMPL family transporter [Planctomycetota bacterium]
MPPAPASPFLAFLIRRRLVLLGLGLLLAGAAALLGTRLQLDRSIEHMFADDDPILQPYRELQEKFGQNEIAMVVYSEPELQTEQGLARVALIADQARKIPGVVAVVSIHDPPGAANFEDTDHGAKLRQVFASYTHNEALNAAGIVCLLARPQTGDPRHSETLHKLRALVTDLPDGALVGEPVLIEEAFDLLEVDGKRLNTWCTLLLMLTIFACFRSWRWLLLPLVVVQLTLALTRGTLVALDLQLSMVSSMLSAIVTVVGVATVVHIIVRYRNAEATGLRPAKALQQAGQLLAAPIFFACLTDAAGFAALMTSRVGPVHDFGLMMAIGSLLVLVSVVLAVPGIVLLGKAKGNTETSETQSLSGKDKDSATSAFNTEKLLQHFLQISQNHAKTIAALTLVASGFAIYGSTRLHRETDFTRNFHQNSRIVQEYEFVEQHFGGAGVWDILLPPTRQLSKRYLAKVLTLEKKMRKEIPLLNKVTSVADVLDASMGGIGVARIGLSVMRVKLPEFVNTLYRQSPPQEKKQSVQLRLLLRTPERLEAAEKNELIQQVRETAQAAFPGAEVTGYYVLLNELIESLLRDQWTTFSVAAIAVFVMMTLAFRSISLAFATLIPNALPVLLLFGAMGWLGIKVNMGAAMIAAVSLGLSVDGSIHYVMSYQRLRRENVSLPDALASVQATVGRAAIFATLALVVGFATLCYSDFIPTIYFGALVSLSMIGGLVGNLLVLPLLIRWVERKK